MDDYISRQAAIDELMKTVKNNSRDRFGGALIHWTGVKAILTWLPSADVRPVEKWIPIKTRPMTEEEIQYCKEHDIDLDMNETEYFDCKMPDDGQQIYVTTKNGYVFDDVCEIDGSFYGLEGNGDWWDIIAWIPKVVPEPYKGGDAE